MKKLICSWVWCRPGEVLPGPLPASHCSLPEILCGRRRTNNSFLTLTVGTNNHHGLYRVRWRSLAASQVPSAKIIGQAAIAAGGDWCGRRTDKLWLRQRGIRREGENCRQWFSRLSCSSCESFSRLDLFSRRSRWARPNVHSALAIEHGKSLFWLGWQQTDSIIGKKLKPLSILHCHWLFIWVWQYLIWKLVHTMVQAQTLHIVGVGWMNVFKLFGSHGPMAGKLLLRVFHLWIPLIRCELS